MLQINAVAMVPNACHRRGAPNLGFIVMPMLGTTVTLKGEREHTNRVQQASNLDAATLRHTVSCSEAALRKTQVIYLMGLFLCVLWQTNVTKTRDRWGFM